MAFGWSSGPSRNLAVAVMLGMLHGEARQFLHVQTRAALSSSVT